MQRMTDVSVEFECLEAGLVHDEVGPDDFVEAPGDEVEGGHGFHGDIVPKEGDSGGEAFKHEDRRIN